MSAVSPQDLGGHALPPGSFRLGPQHNRLLHDAMYSQPHPEPHPLAAFVIAERGIGVTLAGLFRLLGSDMSEGPLLAESAIELNRPLTEDTEYQVDGVIESVERRHSRRIGPYDRVTCRFELREGDARDRAATVINVFAIPRADEGQNEQR